MKYAVITGAASGLGKDLAQLYSSSFHIIAIDRDAEGLQQLQHSIPALTCIESDLADPQQRETLVRQLHDYQDIALLINNAGITHRSLIKETDYAVFDKVMQIDYLAPVRLTLALLPVLTQQRGVVINVSSMAGWMPVIERGGYCAAKSAMHQFFETLRAESGSSIHVLNVYPAFLATPIEKRALDSQGNIATHARSSVGRIRSSQWMAKRIVNAHLDKKSRLYGSALTRFAALLYHCWPQLYLHLMRKRFSGTH